MTVARRESLKVVSGPASQGLVSSSGLAQNTSEKADVVTNWNSLAVSAIRANNTPPPSAARNLAILHASIYDAVNGICQTHKPFFVTSLGPAGASVEASACAGPYGVLMTS